MAGEQSQCLQVFHCFGCQRSDVHFFELAAEGMVGLSVSWVGEFPFSASGYILCQLPLFCKKLLASLQRSQQHR